MYQVSCFYPLIHTWRTLLEYWTKSLLAIKYISYCLTLLGLTVIDSCLLVWPHLPIVHHFDTPPLFDLCPLTPFVNCSSLWHPPIPSAHCLTFAPWPHLSIVHHFDTPHDCLTFALWPGFVNCLSLWHTPTVWPLPFDLSIQTQMVECQLDSLIIEMLIPLDRLTGTALAARQAQGILIGFSFPFILVLHLFHKYCLVIVLFIFTLFVLFTWFTLSEPV